MTDTELVRSAARELKPWLVGVRRDIHMNPELGLSETRTADAICGYLDGLGIEHVRRGTAVVGLVRGTAVPSGAARGGTVALRADIDALPIDEENDVPYRSTRKGVMHACGHDAHTTILLGTGRFFAEHRDRLAGTVKLLFQPDEEGDGGAETMIRDGCLENPRVDRVIGLHVMPYLPVGHIEVKKGVLNGCSTQFHITVHGKSGHGAYPEVGIDAVLIASHLVVALNTLVARAVSPLDEAVITVGTIHGGARSNIIADRVEMDAILRTARTEVRDLLVDRVRSLVTGIPAAFGGSGELAVVYGYTALVNHDAEVDAVAAVGAELLGPDAVHWKDKPSMGVEDFAYFVKERPGVFYHLGCGNPERGITSALHSPTFDIDEDCLPTGVALQSLLALRLLERVNADAGAGR